ncbi:S8 family serine peptidase [Arenimonas sp. MALMAid1274]|uniref:S8 family serine peptidase n=1 Tax=Arenimonas sp. MALMAid1274 TaxID=3411630 RepID=UPI003BA057E5
MTRCFRLLAPLVLASLSALPTIALAQCGPDIELGGRQYIVKFSGKVAPAMAAGDRSSRVKREIGSQATWVRSGALGTEIVRMPAVEGFVGRHQLSALMAQGRIEYIVEDKRMQPLATPNDPRFVNQYALANSPSGISAPAAWDLGTGTGAVIAILDTGITPHPDLNANLVAGYDFVSDPMAARDGNARDANPTDEGTWVRRPGCTPYPSSWHGTHVAGIAGAVWNNGIGIAGTAPGARIMPVRVLGAGGGVLSDIAAGITWAAGGSVPGVPNNPNPVEVINLSLGVGGACGPVEQAAIDFARSQGVVVVAAAGNSALNGSFSPASCNGVISVAATHYSGGRATFSNYGADVDIAAPGVEILSTINMGETRPTTGTAYVPYSGTSMSAPHVAGVVALMQSLSPRTPVEVEQILAATAKPFPMACEGCGAGIVNAFGALQALSNLPPVASFSETQPTVCQTGGSKFTYTLTSTSTDPDNAIVSHVWDLGNGVTASGVSTTLVRNAGQWGTVSLTVTDAAGASATTSRIIGFTCTD